MWKKPSNIVVLVLLLGVVGLTFWVLQNPEEEVEEEPVATIPPIINLFSIEDGDEIVRLTITDHENDRFIGLEQKSAEEWLVLNPEPEPADAILAFSYIGQVRPILIQRTISDVTDLNQFGVLDPRYTIEVSVASGDEFTVYIGDQLVDGGAYYVLIDGEDVIKTVNSVTLEGVLSVLNNPPFLEPTEAPLLPDETPGTE